MGPLRIDSRQRARAVRYAFLGNLLPLGVAIATDFGSHHAVFFVGALGGLAAAVAVNAVSRRHRVIFYAAAYGGLPALTMLQAYSGGAASGYSILMLVALIWFGLQATDREQVAAMALLAACAYLPMLIFGPPAYPVEWGNATLLVLVGGMVMMSLRLVARETTRLTDRLREQARVDELTGLLNRRGWLEAAGRELAQASREGFPVEMVLLDLDDLKQLNDSMGHDEGDRVLRETADRLRGALRAGDVVARVGGDEFVALMPQATLDDALGAIQRLQEVTPSIGSFSAGIASWNAKEDLDGLIRRSDIALYAAKADGGSKVEVAPRALEDAPQQVSE
jgi:diguanylate cyclase (GGDEF)-like protein